MERQQSLGGGGRRNFSLKGFTLAEVLITLGIIGVVAAMTLPTLIQKHQKKVSAVRLAQTYSQLSQAVLLAQKDHGEFADWDYGSSTDITNDGGYEAIATNFCKRYIVPYLKISKDRGWQTSFKNAGYANDIYTLSGFRAMMSQKRYYIELANGVTLFIRQDNNGANTIRAMLIYADINGKTKPNRLGHDIFLIFLTPNAGVSLMPNGRVTTREDLIKDCNKNGDGLYCGAVIMLDGWEIKDNYPW